MLGESRHGSVTPRNGWPSTTRGEPRREVMYPPPLSPKLGGAVAKPERGPVSAPAALARGLSTSRRRRGGALYLPAADAELVDAAVEVVVCVLEAEAVGDRSSWRTIPKGLCVG